MLCIIYFLVLISEVTYNFFVYCNLYCNRKCSGFGDIMTTNGNDLVLSLTKYQKKLAAYNAMHQSVYIGGI